MEPNILEVYYRHRQEDQKVTEAIMERLDKHDQAIAAFNKTNQDMQEVLGYFLAAKGGFTVLSWIGKAAKWLWPPIAVLVAIGVYIKSGRWEVKL